MPEVAAGELGELPDELRLACEDTLRFFSEIGLAPVITYDKEAGKVTMTAEQYGTRVGVTIEYRE